MLVHAPYKVIHLSFHPQVQWLIHVEANVECSYFEFRKSLLVFVCMWVGSYSGCQTHFTIVTLQISHQYSIGNSIKQ